MTLDLTALSQELGVPIEELEAANAKAEAILSDLMAEAKTPEQWEKIANSIKNDKGLEAEFRKRGELAREFTWNGFRNFFWCWTQKDLPEHSKDWFDGILAQKTENKTGTVIEAFRESAKTTIITIGFTAWFIGLYPNKENLLIQVGDDIAKDNSSKISEIIKDSPAWKYCFPHVVPDKESGWGDKGYFVKRDDISADEWQRMVAERKAPTLLGVGYTSDAIIGKHPNGLLVIDDIVNESNSSSTRELNSTLNVLQGTIFYTITQDTITIVVGTPWKENDVIDFCKKTGEFVKVLTPAYTEKNGVVKYAWPEQRGEAWVERKRKITSQNEFARMVLLDLSKTGTKAYRYQEFPNEKIDWTWPMIAGVDPVNSVPAITGREGGTSHFSLAMVLKTPYNKALVADGYVEKCSADDGERKIIEVQKMYLGFERASIEIDGGGILFASMVSRNQGLKVSPHRTAELPKGKKADRQYKFLEPLFRNGIVVISNANTPFLNRLRSYLDNFPNFEPHAPEWDVADSVLLAVFDMPEVWTQISTNVDGEDSQRNIFAQRKLAPSPWSSLGARRK